MKKLMRILASLFPVTSVSSTIVACDDSDEETAAEPNDDSGEEADSETDSGSDSGSDSGTDSGSDGETSNSEAEELSKELIEEQLSAGIDGKLLNKDSKISDALKLIIARVEEIHPKFGEVELLDNDDHEKNLEKGDNSFSISFDVGGKKEQFLVTVKDVQDDLLNNNELDIFIRDNITEIIKSDSSLIPNYKKKLMINLQNGKLLLVKKLEKKF